MGGGGCVDSLTGSYVVWSHTKIRGITVLPHEHRAMSHGVILQPKKKDYTGRLVLFW